MFDFFVWFNIEGGAHGMVESDDVTYAYYFFDGKCKAFQN